MIGLFAFAIVMVFQFVTIGNEADYYTLKEAMEASMYEAIDIDYYRGVTQNANSGNIKSTAEVKIVQEKFVSNFTRRFLKNTMGNSEGYVIEFYDIMEMPPKATIIIKNAVASMSLSENNFTVINNLTGILEADIVESDYSGGCPAGTTLKSGRFNKNDYYYFQNYDNSIKNIKYRLNSDTIKSGIVSNDRAITSVSQIKNLRISSARIVDFVNNASYASASLYDCVYNNGQCSYRWISDAIESKTSNCPNTLSLNSSVKIINSSGDNPEVQLFYSSSGEGSANSCDQVCQYSITWSYNYCG